jgi:hypothetical protein
VFYLERKSEDLTLRAKYAVISAKDFAYARPRSVYIRLSGGGFANLLGWCMCAMKLLGVR